MSFHVFGDVHGHPHVVVPHLHAAGLVSECGDWTGGDSVLWFIGDFTDRGPDGIGAIELAMRLQTQACDSGGKVNAILGNHEFLFLGADKFGDRLIPGSRTSFYQLWDLNGGQRSDLERLTDDHRQWIETLPAMALEQDRLLVHADSTFYSEYGTTLPMVCESMSALLASDDLDKWGLILKLSARRREFAEDAARWMLHTYGGRRIVHGHTPIPLVSDIPATSVTGPLEYADGLCVNVDGGIYSGGPGFLHTEHQSAAISTSSDSTA